MLALNMGLTAFNRARREQEKKEKKEIKVEELQKEIEKLDLHNNKKKGSK